MMLHKPPPSDVERFLARQATRGLSYPEVGRSRDDAPVAGYDNDHNRIQLGHGPAAFEAACNAIRRWCMFPGGWVTVVPAGQAIEVGRVVAMVARVQGLWWMNACRIVYVLEETVPVRRFGFAYGTLPGHVECGEERFSVEWLADDSVWYHLRAFSRPRHPLARLAYPLARRQQRRFVRESLAGMQRAVAEVQS